MSDAPEPMKTCTCSQCGIDFKSPSYIYPRPSRCNVCISLLFEERSEKRGVKINPNPYYNSSDEEYSEDDEEEKEDDDSDDENYRRYGWRSVPPAVLEPPAVQEPMFCVICDDPLEISGSDCCDDCIRHYHLYKK